MVIFKNSSFRVFLLFSLGVLLVYNSYSFFLGNKFAIAPIFFQTTIIVLIIKKNKFLKGILKVWSGLFMILLPGIQLITQLVYFWLEGPEAVDSNKLIRLLLFVILGLGIYYFTDKTIEVKY